MDTSSGMMGQEGVIPVQMSWVVDIQEEADSTDFDRERQISKSAYIYRVTSRLKGSNAPAYTPQVVSFGPYHHGEGHLLPMEHNKRRCLVHFIKRSEKQLRSFVEEMEKVEQQLMDAYDGLGDEWRLRVEKGGQFLQLMIMDGCFMLEIMRFTLESTTAAAPAAAGGTTNVESKYMDYGSNDPIFSSHGVFNVVPYIQKDMLMLENQLPLLVLDKLVAVESGKLNSSNDEAINRMVVSFFTQQHVVAPLGLHPLDVYRRSKLHGPSLDEAFPHKKRKEEWEVDIIRSAMGLKEGGVRLVKSRSGSLRDIRFAVGTLYLPVVVVDDFTECMFRNLMAFERLHVDAGNEVTSYVVFMAFLINSTKDVSLLSSRGIIVNAIGGDEDVVKLFKTLSKEEAIDPHSFANFAWCGANLYCSQNWNALLATQLRTYFPAAAIFLTLLTVTQTVFAILQWLQGSDMAGHARRPT